MSIKFDIGLIQNNYFIYLNKNDRVEISSDIMLANLLYLSDGNYYVLLKSHGAHISKVGYVFEYKKTSRIFKW